MDPVIAPAHGHIYEEERPHAVGPHTATAGEEEHHEKKPVMKKVKDKVKRFKDTISNKMKHGHGDDRDQANGHAEEEEGCEEDDEEVEVDPQVHGGPMSGNAAAPHVVGGQDEGLERERGTSGIIKGSLEKDPPVPESRSEKFTAGGDEARMSPVVGSFQALKVSDGPEGQQGGERSPPTGTHDHVNQISPPEKTRSGPEERPGESAEPATKQPSYTEKLSSTVYAVKDTAVSAVSTVYGKVAGAGSTGAGKVQQSGAAGGSGGDGKAGQVEKGVSVREYLAEKLRPGEEDKALSEVISESVHKTKEEEAAAERAPATGSGEGSGGKGMVEKIRGVVTSLIGGGAGSGASPVTSPQAKGGEVLDGTHQEPERRDLEKHTE